jgi:DNA recombination protein RmuC
VQKNNFSSFGFVVIFFVTLRANRKYGYMEIIYGLVLLLVATVAAVGAFNFGKKQTPVDRKQVEEALEQEKARGREQREELKATFDRQVEELKQNFELRLQEQRAANEKQLAEQKESANKQLAAQKESADRQLADLKESYEKQMVTMKETAEKQLADQMKLIKEQMQTTSEQILKARQEELGETNKEQVSKIIDPLQQSLKLMREALDDSKEKHQEALHKLDATIQANMKNSEHLSDTAERLTRALTGEVKLQGNFGELKLKQLLEDLGLKDGEQYSSQEHLRDKLGNQIKDDEGKGLIPDFILHFPNKRDVVVDSKMSFTAYERYVNAASPEEQTQALRDHLVSVRAQVDRLAKKDYSKYLQAGYNKLNFVIMYIHTEGALNLALLNDTALWREAYDKGVLILGPQTMYMNLRILELMWTQVRQLNNQEEMILAANQIVERTQKFAKRFATVETNMEKTMNSMAELKKSTADGGQSIITSAKKLVKAGARESRDAISLNDAETLFIDSETTPLLNS